jgi:hypothetical protein
MQGMGDNSYASEIVRDGKTLILLTAGLQKKSALKHIEGVVIEDFEKLTPYLREDRQVIYIRDIPDHCIDGEFPTVTCDTNTEATIAIPSWSVERRNMELFEMSVHQAMLLLARVQNIGPNQTFGDDVFSQGIAAHYASLMTSYTLPYEGMMVTKRLLRMALRRWDTKRYYASWLAGGKRSNWHGHIVGCALAMAVIPKHYGKPFDVEFAIKSPGRMLDNQLWGLFHNGQRAAFARHGQAQRPFWSYIVG